MLMGQGLPGNIYGQCFNILKLCDEFGDDDLLKAVFVTPELILLRDNLPQAKTKNDRVTKTITFLYDQSIAKKEPFLSYFIKILHIRYSGDRLQSQLTDLYYNVEKIYRAELQISNPTSDSPMELPFVIFAMTNSEAKELFDESVFVDASIPPKDKEHFSSFKEALYENGINLSTDLNHCYDGCRDNWKPINSDNNISDAIDIIIRHIITERLSSDEPPIQPKFLSKEFFEGDSSIRLDVWEQLGESGCILIIDAVSLFHPKLRLMLSNSGLSSTNKTAILIMSPLNSYENSVNDCIEDLIDSHLELAFSRYSKKWDKLCEIGIGNSLALQRWLYAAIPNEVRIMSTPEPNSKAKNILRSAMNMNPGYMGYAIAGHHLR
jgi:hypothetical protein